MAETEISIEDPGNREILVRAGLFSADPASITGLTDRMSVDVGIDPAFQPIPYDTRHTTQEKVRCSVCVHRAWHNIGFIVRNDVGELGLVGWECGESRLFGEGGWQQMVNRTELAQKEAIYKHRWMPAREAAKAAFTKLNAWTELTETVDQEQIELDETFPDLMSAMRSELVDGSLSVTQMVLVPYTAPDGSERMAEKPAREVVLRTKAAWFFRKRTLSGRVRGAQRKLQALRAAKEMIEECMAMEASLSELNRDDFWMTVAKWARSEKVPPGKFQVKGRRLCAHDNAYDYTFQLPAFDVGQLQASCRELLNNWPTI
jgi:hypothetical protein